MKCNSRPIQIALLAITLLGFESYSQNIAYANDVCSSGVSEPPFLSYGVKSNLLLVLDNSGSMLDLAYTDPDGTQCFDDSFGVDPTVEYIGTFDTETWFKRVEGVLQWGNITYVTGDIVAAEGGIYRALNGGTSIGTNIFEDTVVSWEPLLRPSWKNNTVYYGGAFVFDNTTSKVYTTAAGGTSSGTVVTDDIAVTWTEVLPWVNSTVYAAGTYVIWEGGSELYLAQNAGTSNGSKPWDDTGVTWVRVDFHGWKSGRSYIAGDYATANSMIFKSLTSHTAIGDDIYEDNFGTNWQRLDEGYFEEISKDDAAIFCSSAGVAGSVKHTASDVCITLDPAVTNTSPGKVYAFAASGSFLNWAMASKFDIEKKILTGGKYDSDAGMTISEGRGCAGNRFIKQVLLDQGTAVTLDDYYLTMTVRGANDADRTDMIDEITRLEIYAVSEDGMDFGACQDAIEAFQDPAGLGPAESDVEACVGFDASSGSNVEHIVYHKAIQECWFYAKHGRWKGGNDHPLKTCPQYYDQGNIPAYISPFDPAYVCYGVYDAGSHENREGFVGRCWETAGAVSGACEPQACRDVPVSGSYPHYYVSGTTTRRCLDAATEGYCDGNFNSNNKKCNGGEWLPLYQFVAGGAAGCVPNPGDVSDTSGWSENLDGVPPVPDADADEICVDQAMNDFCLQAEVPEVIDPSDQVTTTDEFWNLPAILVDTGLAGQLGGHPLMSLKGYTLYNLPAEQLADDVNRPDGPRGVIFEVASDLRMGVMAFSNNGSASECSGVNTSDTVIEYCPADNRDGASVLANIDIGYYEDDNGTPDDNTDDFEVWDHYNTLVQSINDVRATSWTPLAEAVFNAIGYYTQDATKRLDVNDFEINATVDPITNWCQDNHVLIITEGASTADTSQTVIDYVNDVAVTHGFDDDDASDEICVVPDAITGADVGLQGSTYLDDITNIGQNLSVDLLYPVGQDTLINSDGEEKSKKNITTHIVSTGTVRSSGAGECNPYTMIRSAAIQGGTNLVESQSPAQLEANLLATFNDLRQRSSAGSAASVISSSRGGEGAIYQAIFWPEINRDHQDGTNYKVEWVGDVHALFINDAGLMFEDTDGDRALDPSEDIDGDGILDVNEDTNQNGLLDATEDVDGDGKLDVAEDINGNNVIDGNDLRVVIYFDEGERKSKACYNTLVFDTGTCSNSKELNEVKFIWSAADWLNDPALLTDTNRDYMSDDKERYIITWNDLNNDGIVDNATEVLPFVEGLADSVVPAGVTRSPLYADFGVASSAEADAIISWVRGDDSLNNEDLDGDGNLFRHEDLDNDGVFDIDEDVDGDGNLDINEDVDGDGNLDIVEDIDGDGIIDVDEDLNGNGVLDPGEDVDGDLKLDLVNEDVDGDGKLDLVNEDVDGDGKLDLIDEDLAGDGDGKLDDSEDLNNDSIFQLSEDINGNGVLDAGEDTDGDGFLDTNEDLNGNGRLDYILRSRQIPSEDNGNILTAWRLGDVIHSTPMTVSDPAEGFHLLYRDRTYANFVARHKERRHMIYYGGNDGMLHAANGGFYKQDEKKFCLTSAVDVNGDCDESAGNYPALGAEMWAYVPYNILPHLSCLTEEAYEHKYFVDLRPRIFDVKIFEEEVACSSDKRAAGCIHPDGWGTILVGGMRLGGTPANGFEVSPDVSDTVGEDNRQFISSYFILDITNPEEPPVVLGELTQSLDGSENPIFADLGHSVGIPSMVIMKNPATFSGTESNEWYLILGSGPHGDDAMKGVSDQDAKVSILPLSWLGTNGSAKEPLRIPATEPVSGSPGGTFTLNNSPDGFVSDLVTIDFDIDPSTFDYMADAVYFGTTEGDFVLNADGSTEWNGGGKLYRLVTRTISGGVSQYGSGITQVPTTPDEWEILPLIDLSGTNKPISSAASVGYDGRNFWVYFGTGRFWDPEDKTDDNQQTFFGIKEPMTFNSSTGAAESFLWDEVEFLDNIDSSGDANFPTNTPAGDRGLMRVDDILVAQSSEARYSKLTCLDTTDTVNGSPLTGANSLNCIPSVIRQGSSPDTAYFSRLERYIAGIKVGTCTDDQADCTDGWYKDYWPYNNRERNLGQGTLLGGLLTFTTYQPFSDVCKAEGLAYLYAVYYKTGTSWYENIFGEYGLDDYGNVENKLDLGRGLASSPNLHTGSGGAEGPRAFVQTSTGEIKEIQQENLPVKAYKSGRSKWKEYIP